jgi:hypothetical protein
MIPLSWFLVAWLILLAIYALLVLFTLIQMLRHGLPSPLTYASTFLFVAVIAAVVLGSGMYFLNVNWNESVSLLPSSINALIPGDVSSEGPVDIPL